MQNTPRHTVSRRRALARVSATALTLATLGSAALPVFADHHKHKKSPKNAIWTQAPKLVNAKTEAVDSVTGIASEGQYTVLHFLLKTECPICLRHTHSYYRAEMNTPNVKNVFIKPDSLSEIRGWMTDASDEAPVIHQDPNARLAEFAGIPDGYRFHGETIHYPALIILDPSGQEVFRYVGKRTQDRYSLKSFKKTFAEITKN